MTTASPLANNYKTIQQNIDAACASSRRKKSDITVVGVCKHQPLEKIQEALSLGLGNLGGNYVQELKAQVEATPDAAVTWHFVGHLQRNKVKDLLKIVGKRPFLLHSLDRLSLAQEIEHQAAASATPVRCLIQVLPEALNNHPERSGCPEADIPSLIKTLKDFSYIHLQGLMVLPPASLTGEEARPFFQHLKNLAERLEKDPTLQTHVPLHLPHLSMGMSQDYTVAIEEGATLVRIGTALFGKRN